MRIKINDKIFSFPPHISTTWDQILTLRSEKNANDLETLMVTLKDGSLIRIPGLEPQLVQTIFSAHLKFLENQAEQSKNPIGFDPSNAASAATLNFPLRFGSAGLEGLGSVLQHNPAQADSPPLPAEILNKITSVAKIMVGDEMPPFPQPEPNCNCMHCQIARALQLGLGHEESYLEEEVTDEDLKFRIWDIIQNGDKLYTLTNPLDQTEQYHVYLGEPIGCTCGEKNCEHIRAVLSS